MKSNTHPVWKNPYVTRFNEAPLTIIRDLYATLKVELIQGPKITGALREFVECGSMSKAPDFAEAGSSLTQLVEENALWQGLETLHFTFRVTGCSRLLTHQLVRQRIGITFSQQCSDSVDWRHQNIVLPRVVPFSEGVRAINAKMRYAALIDSMKVSCQEARYVLPQCLETFLYIHASLATLAFMLKKRECTMSQPWETYLWAYLTWQAITREFPALKKLLSSECAAMKCFYHRAKENPTSAYLYQPDSMHNCKFFDWNPKSYIYKQTHREMSEPESMKPHATRYYLENMEISSTEYVKRATEVGI